MPSESLSFRPEWKQLRLLPYLPSRGSLVANVVLIFEALSQVAKMERLLAPRVNPGCRIPPMQSLGKQLQYVFENLNPPRDKLGSSSNAGRAGGGRSVALVRR